MGTCPDMHIYDCHFDLIHFSTSTAVLIRMLSSLISCSNLFVRGYV